MNDIQGISRNFSSGNCRDYLTGYSIGYLISRYPAVSHTFILREVLGLKQLGFNLRVASINPADRLSAGLTAAEKVEQAACFYVKRSAGRHLLSDFFSVLCRTPVRLLKTAAFAVSANGMDLKKAAKNLLYLAEAVLVGGWMRRSKLTHLHVHFATPAATVALLASKLTGVTLSITVHGPDEFYETAAYLLPAKCSQASFLCAISDYAASQLKRMLPVNQWSKVKVVPLGVDLAHFHPVRREGGDGVFEILCVGRLVPAKGQHVLLEALHLLRAAGRPVKLVLVGDGPDRHSLEQEVEHQGLSSSVVFAGAVNQDNIIPFYARADIFVMASFAEGLPVVLMEAMAMEIPVVSTWITGVPELIRDGIDGLLVPPANAPLLAETVARLMDDASLRVSLQRAGRRRIFEKYALSTNVSRLARVFAEHFEQTVTQPQHLEVAA